MFRRKRSKEGAGDLRKLDNFDGGRSDWQRMEVAGKKGWVHSRLRNDAE